MRQTNRLAATILSSLAGLTLMLLAPAAHATTLAFYDFEASNASKDTDLFSAASEMSYVDEIVLFNIFPNVGNPGSAASAITRFTTINDAKLYDVPFKVTLAPVPGYAMNLYYLETDLAAANSNAAGFAAQLFVYSSLDNFADPIHFNVATDTTPSGTTIDPGPYSTVTSEGMLVNQSLYSNVTTPVEFRFYFLGTSVQAGLLDNVRISGTMAAVPEPLGLAGVSAAMMLNALRRRRQV